MYELVGAFVSNIITKAGDLYIATYNLLASLVGK